MDVYCPKCGEPFDNDEFHDIAAERTRVQVPALTVGDMFPPPVGHLPTTYKGIAADFRKRGCIAIDGKSCEPNEDAAGIAEVYELLGDDMDGAAGLLDEFREMQVPAPAEPPVSPYTNDFKGIGLSPEMALHGQRQVLLAAVQRAIFCPLSNVVLDRARSVLVLPSDGGGLVMDSTVWDDRHTAVAEAAATAGITLEVYDGRELW